jgi:hypothetical protein
LSLSSSRDKNRLCQRHRHYHHHVVFDVDACIAVIILVVVVVVVGVWLSRVRELGGLIGASQCRVIAEKGLGLTSIC